MIARSARKLERIFDLCGKRACMRHATCSVGVQSKGREEKANAKNARLRRLLALTTMLTSAAEAPHKISPKKNNITIKSFVAVLVAQKLHIVLRRPLIN